MGEFEKLRVIPPILKAVAEMGFEKPTEVQELVIPLMLQGSDVVVQSQTGTGKTAAFAISILQTLDPHGGIQALIVVPTRELCLQVVDEFAQLGKHMRFGITPVYGGVSMENQVRLLRGGGTHVVVATPGRLLDHMRQGTIDLTRVRVLVLDEADLMLDMGFIDDVRTIISGVPQERQTSLFSATLPLEIAQLAEEYLVSPETVRIREEQLAVDRIEQEFLSLDPREKVSALATLFKARSTPSAIVFCRTKMGADSLERSLRSLGFNCRALHGNLSQAQRERVMNEYHAKRFNILVATDIAARGLDIQDVELVVNYNLPEDPKVYVHRIGRTARAGKKGQAVSFCTNLEETRFIEQVAIFSNSAINQLKLEIDRSLVPKHMPRGDFGGGRRFGGRGGFGNRGGDRGRGQSSGGRHFHGSPKSNRYGQESDRGESRGGYAGRSGGFGGNRPHGRGPSRPRFGGQQ